MNPSCAVTKLTDAHGRRPDAAYRSELPVSREATSPMPPWPRQKSRTASRKRPFHSDHATPNPPTR